MITLSKRQIKAADRFSGAWFLLPWPGQLPQPKPAASGAMRDATAAERAAMLAAIGVAARENDLTMHDVVVLWTDRRPQVDPQVAARRGQVPPVAPYLCAFLLHRRWPQKLTKMDNPAAKWCWLGEE